MISKPAKERVDELVNITFTSEQPVNTEVTGPGGLLDSARRTIEQSKQIIQNSQNLLAKIQFEGAFPGYKRS